MDKLIKAFKIANYMLVVLIVSSLAIALTIGAVPHGEYNGWITVFLISGVLLMATVFITAMLTHYENKTLERENNIGSDIRDIEEGIYVNTYYNSAQNEFEQTSRETSEHEER